MFFKKKKKDYNYWLNEEIKRCQLFNKDLTLYITPDTHPLQAKWIAKALINEFSESQVTTIANIKYTDERILDDLYCKLQNEPDLKYFLNNYKPDITKQGIEQTDGYLGAILGDMIGQPYEFTPHDKIENLYGRMIYTDDTVLTIATLDAIKENPKNPDFRKHYIEMYNNYKNAGYGSSFIRWCIEGSDTKWGYGSYANGSAMRVSPIGYCYRYIEDVIKQAYQSAIVTHNHIDGVKGAVVTAVICWMCKNNYTKEEIKIYLEKHYKYTQAQRQELENGNILFDLNNIEENNFDKNYSLFCNYAVPYATWCFLESNDFDDCMQKVLSHFCDADTICAIAGGFAYGYYKEKKKDIIIEKLDERLRSKI